MERNTKSLMVNVLAVLRFDLMNANIYSNCISAAIKLAFMAKKNHFQNLGFRKANIGEVLRFFLIAFSFNILNGHLCGSSNM